MSFLKFEKYWIDELHSDNMLQIAKSVSHIRNCYGDTHLVRFACAFVAPVYIAYAKFIVNDARRRGIKKLYFINRDAYLIWKIVESFNLSDIDCEYIFLSRKSLSLPYLRNGDCDKFKFISGLDGKFKANRDINELLSRIGLSLQEIHYKYNIIYNQDNADTDIEINRFINSLFRNESFIKCLRQNGLEQYNLFHRYIKQKGLTESPELSAIVDIGWIGTTRAMLKDLLESNNIIVPLHYYLGTSEDVLSCQYGDFVSFIDSSEKLYSFPCVPILENYFSLSPYGSTISYKSCPDGTVIPVLSKRLDSYRYEALRANVNVCTELAKIISSMQYQMSADLMKKWASISLKAMLNYDRMNVKYQVLGHGKSNEGKPLVKKIGILKSLKFLLCEITPQDKLNMFYSFPYHYAKNIMRVHYIISRLRL